MICHFCKTGETAPGVTTVTVERGQTTVVIKRIPADVCGTCGEAYLADQVVERLEKMVDEAVAKGTEVEIVRYAA